MYDRVICTEIGTRKKFQNRIRPQATLVNICPVPYYEIMLAALFSRGRVPITGFLRFFRSATTAVICCGTITVTLYLSSCTTAMLPRFFVWGTSETFYQNPIQRTMLVLVSNCQNFYTCITHHVSIQSMKAINDPVINDVIG